MAAGYHTQFFLEGGFFTSNFNHNYVLQSRLQFFLDYAWGGGGGGWEEALAGDGIPLCMKPH